MDVLFVALHEIGIVDLVVVDAESGSVDGGSCDIDGVGARTRGEDPVLER